jgi:hypothetical protein
MDLPHQRHGGHLHSQEGESLTLLFDQYFTLANTLQNPEWQAS